MRQWELFAPVAAARMRRSRRPRRLADVVGPSLTCLPHDSPQAGLSGGWRFSQFLQAVAEVTLGWQNGRTHAVERRVPSPAAAGVADRIGALLLEHRVAGGLRGQHCANFGGSPNGPCRCR